MKKIILAIMTAALLAGVLIACTPVGAGTDTTAPTVSATTPSGTGVATNAVITATFDEAMTTATIVAANFTVSPSVAGTVSYNATSMVATFTPTSILATSAVYTATITTGVKDLAGNALAANKVWSFTTAATGIATSPANSATGVPININNNIRAAFSTDMDPTTIVGANFALTTGGSAVTGAVTYDVPNKTAIFAPQANLAPLTTYTATITTGVTDKNGNHLAASKVWSFTTAAQGAGPLPVSLETAGNYVILANTAISNIPSSVITGNVGISPNGSGSVTGFTLINNVAAPNTLYATSTQVASPGNVYTADMAGGFTTADLTRATTNQSTAYTFASSPQLGYTTETVATVPGGTSFAPGTYVWNADVSITGNITVTSTDPNAVWIFITSGKLGIVAQGQGSGIGVILGGAAQAKNVFWAVAGITTIGTYDTFAGVILGASDIVLQTGASLNGRAISSTQVTLDKATVTQP